MHTQHTVVEAEVTKSPDVSIRLLALDPSARHTLAVIRNARTGAHETHYMHRCGCASFAHRVLWENLLWLIVLEGLLILSSLKALLVELAGVLAAAMLKVVTNAKSQPPNLKCQNHSSWTKPRPLAKLAGVAVSAVGWQRQPRPGGSEDGGDVDLVNTTG